tara:strand:+ start:750 stop:1214 length:465 start_codon:yes stop_codon:yes gene_type:complete
MIYKIENIFKNSERRDLLKQCKPYLNHIPTCPAIQTYSDLCNKSHLKPFFNIIKNKIEENTKLKLNITKSWMNLDYGDKENIFWHNHEGYYYSAVYYIQTLPFFSSGTLFEEHGFIRMKQNSLLLFPSHLIHGTPSHPFSFIKRYTLAIDFMMS